MLDRTVHLSSVLLLLQGLTLVILLLTLAEGDINLGTSVVVDEDERRHDGVTRLLGVFLQSSQLTLGEQQLAVTTSLMVAKRTIEIRRDVHALHPEFAIVEVTIAIHERSLAASDRLDFSTRQHDAGGISVNKEVLEGSLDRKSVV